MNRSDNGTFFATGEAAANLSRIRSNDNRRSSQEAVATRLLAVKDSRGVLTGGLSELLPGSDVFITARHVLQGISVQDMDSALSGAGLSIEDMAFVGFKDSAGLIDAIVVVPVEKLSEYFNFDSSGSGSRLKLLGRAEFRRDANIGDEFSARQFGTIGSQGVTQTSSGIVSAISDEAFYLSLSESNSTTARSSGSVIQTHSSANDAFKVGGIVECVVPPTVSATGVPVHGGVRVIPIRRLLEAEGQMVSPNRLSREARVGGGECIPVDARGGGG